MEEKVLTPAQKLAQLSPELRNMIQLQAVRDSENRKHRREFMRWIKNPKALESVLIETMPHCNAGATVDTGLWLKSHLKQKGKIVITLGGALSSFEIGKLLAPLIRANKIHLVSATGANHEESYYRYVAHSYYAYIPNYQQLTPAQEDELRQAGYRRITSTFLPEEESVRVIEPHITAMIRQAGASLHPVNTDAGYMLVGDRLFPHEYFALLFSRKLIKKDPLAKAEDCWVQAAYQSNVPVIIPGFEDSTMGNIIAGYTFEGKLGKKRFNKTLNPFAIKTGIEYMHYLYKWYARASSGSPVAFLQLGGGISGDFPICVVSSLKHDLMIENVRDWAGFAEVGSSPMSYGSYSGAGGKEKITWDKLSTESYYNIIQSDATLVFPVIAAMLLSA